MRAYTATMRDLWRRLSRDALDFVYPRSCVHCRAALPPVEDEFGSGDAAASSPFCRSCYEGLACAVERACFRCGAPVGPFLNTASGCRHCRNDQFNFDRVFALGVYEHVLRDCCTRIKGPFEEPLTAALTELLADAHADEWTGLPIGVVVPVPHHWTERSTRPHLAPVTMCGVLSRRLMVPMAPHILAKSQRTPAQTSLTPPRRRTNLRNAFRIAGRARLDGLTVLLVDDILTTGTTAGRAARVLKEAGARQVFVAVIARGLGRSSKR